MSFTVSTYEAKTNLAAILRRVEAGESVTITRRGVKVATLNPPDLVKAARVRKAVDGLRAMWEEGRAKNPHPRKYISRAELHEGHKY